MTQRHGAHPASTVYRLATEDPYATALLDWLACATAGARERAPQAVRILGDDLAARVAFAATAGHVLDYDDTISDGIAHVSAVCAPAALVVAAHRKATIGDALCAFAEGFEAMAALARASHPGLYAAGFHPTAVCGPLGAAVVAAALLGLDAPTREAAVGLGLLRAGGTRGAFGSDAKAIQVGLAAAAGVQGALLAQAGATIEARAVEGPVGFAGVLPARWPGSAPEADSATAELRGIEANWIKRHPSCLGTHAPIDAAERARAGGEELSGRDITVLVHPVARQAAHIDVPRSGLEAKFSIAYCVAHTLRHGPPRVSDFAAVQTAVAEAAAHITVQVEPSLPQFGATLVLPGAKAIEIAGPRGSPAHPATPDDLRAKIAELAGDRLDGALDDPGAPAASLLQAAGLAPA